MNCSACVLHSEHVLLYLLYTHAHGLTHWKFESLLQCLFPPHTALSSTQA
jgi:hypothetical protein